MRSAASWKVTNATGKSWTDEFMESVAIHSASALICHDAACNLIVRDQGSLVMTKTVQERERFALELEFVQCLANPAYLLCIVESGA
ncbi:hypothetical protein PSACC_01673 [Paramicrosporidium saccamoebae]|uniref:Mediator of RNA polymerase II transcription subunit 31 n=1 Tax=Paramicrosporidium saccamoebae TaxID=1246581 RepID=A0A2H9TLI9_9FUNG|nr:hypothetical protein PSACC_01673 [Paramicrosporidium saccamoebae]